MADKDGVRLGTRVLPVLARNLLQRHDSRTLLGEKGINDL